MKAVAISAVAVAVLAVLAAADTTLNFKSTSFKIVQFADMHYSNGVTAGCSNVLPSERPCSDKNTTDFMARVLDAEKPDLVVFSGDNIVGSANDVLQAITEFSQPVVDRQIPWAAVFGNHDDEASTTRAQQMAMYQSLPYSLSEPGPSDVTGVGNYVINLMSQDNTKNLFNIYFLDSGAYSKVSGISGYDWIHASQLNWYVKKAAEFKEANGALIPPPAFAVFHIPIIEYDLMTDFVGDKYEGVFDPNVNSGFFTAIKDAGDVKATFVGHDHVNAGCGTYYDVKLCYAGGVGYGAYGRTGWARRARVTNIEQDGQVSNSWLRLDDETLSTAFPQQLYTLDIEVPTRAPRTA